MIIVDETLPEGDLPPPFPVQNVEVKFDLDMRDNYDLKKEIGRGRFGTVYLCTCKTTGIKFAAKFVNTKRNQDRENVEREIEIMKTLNDNGAHQKLIQLYDAYDMGKEMCLVLEVVNGGELFERVIDDDFELTERACAIFIKQICEGIEFIHSKNILHLDMKPENILCLSREGNRIKICDFGLARKYDPRKKLQVLFGTPEFVAPEVVNFEPISFGTDMWSIGVICYVLLSGLSPFMGHNYVETMTNVTHNKYDFEDEAFDDVSDEVKDFIEHLLLLDKSERLTPSQCYRHRWLRQLENPPSVFMAKDRKNSALNDVTESDTMSPDTETETEDLSSSMDVIDAKLDIKLTKPDMIEKKNDINDNMSVKEEEKKEVIIINVNEEETTNKEIEINANYSTENKNKEFDLSDSKPLVQNLNEPSKKRSNSETEIVLENITNSVKSPEEKRKKLKEFDKQELERTKSNLREFVERWNSHPNSPYMIGSPKLPAVICKLADGIYSRGSFSSIDCAPPSNPDILGLEEVGPDNLNFSPKGVTHITTLSSDKIAIELAQRLESLKNAELSTADKEITVKIEPLKHPEVIALQREAAGSHSSTLQREAGGCHSANLQREDTGNHSTTNVPKEIAKKTDKEVSGGKHRPSRDVINQPDKKYESVTSPDSCQSPILTPGKRSRKTSKERDDRPSSRDSNRSTPAITRRRPSRDVPLTLSQVDRLNILSDSHLDRKSTLDLWPDMICISKDESDSNESENEYKPITGKLELGMKIPSSQKESTPSNTCSKSLEEKQSYFKKMKSVDDQSESKTITWVLDLENAKLPFLSQEGKLKRVDKNTTTDDTGREQNSINTKVQTKPSSSSDTERCNPNSSHSNSIENSSSFDNLTIHTPWGPMRRSPSKTSLKNDDGPIINISECFINVIKPKNEGQSHLKSSPSIELKLYSSPSDNNIVSSDKRKRFSEKSKRIDDKEDPVDKSECNSQHQSNKERHPYELTSTSSMGKYSVNIPNNIKTHKTFTEIQNDSKKEKLNEIKIITNKKKEIEASILNQATVDEDKLTSKDITERVSNLPAVKVDTIGMKLSPKTERSIAISGIDQYKKENSGEDINASNKIYLSLLNDAKEKSSYEKTVEKSKEVIIPIKMEAPADKQAERKIITETSKLAKRTIEIVIPIQKEINCKDELKVENTNIPSKCEENAIEVSIPIERDIKSKPSTNREKPITIQILSDENNTYPPSTRKRSLDRPLRKHLSSEKIDPSRISMSSPSSESTVNIRTRRRDSSEANKSVEVNNHSNNLQTNETKNKTHYVTDYNPDIKKNYNPIQDFTTITSTISRRSSGTSGISNTSDSGLGSRNLSTTTSNDSISRRSSGTSISNNSDLSNENRILSKSPSRSPKQTVDIKKETNGIKSLLNKEDGLDVKNAKENTNQLININSRNLSKSPSRSSKLEQITSIYKEPAEIKGSFKTDDKITSKDLNENTNKKLANIRRRNLSKSPSRSSKVEQTENTKKESSEVSNSLKTKEEIEKSSNDVKNISQIVRIRKRITDNSHERKSNSEMESQNCPKTTSMLTNVSTNASELSNSLKTKTELEKNSNDVKNISQIIIRKRVPDNSYERKRNSEMESKNCSKTNVLTNLELSKPNSSLSTNASDLSISLKTKEELEKNSNDVKNTSQIITIRKRIPDNLHERKRNSEMESQNCSKTNILTNLELSKSNSNLTTNASKGIENNLHTSSIEQILNVKCNSQNDEKTNSDTKLNIEKEKLLQNSEFKSSLNVNSSQLERRSKSPLLNSVSMISIPTSKYEAERQQSTLVKPQPIYHKSDNIQTENENKRNSFYENEEYSTNSLRRKSSKGNLPLSTKKSVGAMLFSAQDRISQFEKKKDDPNDDKALKPVLRSRTSALLSDSQPKFKPSFNNRSSLCENTKTVPSIVCSKSELSTFAFATKRLLNKA